MMRGFLVAVQFLTRFDVGRHENLWSAENCGAGVKFFPLVGALLGACYFTAAVLLDKIAAPAAITAALLLVASLVLTGGIFCDGFMDSADGIFSGRDREKILAIMKDSRVGANAVMAFGTLLLLEWAALFSVPSAVLPITVFVAPIIGRFVAAVVIVAFPYARPEGLGKAFHDEAPPRATLMTATLTTFCFVLPCSIGAVVALAAGFLVGVAFCRHAVDVLGGLTGDTYGAAATLAECTVLVVFALI